MTNFMFAVIIWVKTIIINILLIGLGMIFSKGISGLPFLFIMVIVAFVLTAPLLLMITQAVKISTWLPYVLEAKFAWLLFMLMLISIFFYMILGLPLDASIFQARSEIAMFSLSTIVSIVCAGQLSKNSFKSINTRYEQHLV